MVFEYTRCTISHGSYCDTAHYLVVADVKERLAVSKQATQKLYVEIFNFRKLNEMEVKK